MLPCLYPIRLGGKRLKTSGICIKGNRRKFWAPTVPLEAGFTVTIFSTQLIS